MDCHFEGNLASQGGAIFIGSGSHNLEILRSNFTMNSAFNSDGGAIYFDSSASPASPSIIDDAIFTDNTGFVGGAIYANGYDLNITKTIFSGNAATNNDFVGGAIYDESEVVVCPNVANDPNDVVFCGVSQDFDTIELFTICAGACKGSSCPGCPP